MPLNGRQTDNRRYARLHWQLRRRLRRPSSLPVDWRMDVRPAQRARGVRIQPHVDALDVVQVLARGKPPHLLAGLQRADAHRALRAVTAAVRELRYLSEVHAAAVLRLVAGRGDRRPAAAAIVVEVEEDYEEERGAGEADADVAEDRRSCRRRRRSVLRLWHRRWSEIRRHGAGGEMALAYDPAASSRISTG
jgi:hypothetical protein